MLLGFKRMFAQYVEEGSKTHTIRGERKIAPRVGEIAHCYVDPRQKTMRLLGRFEVVKVERIEIREAESVLEYDIIEVDGQRLSLDECAELAWRDGFRDDGRNGAFFEMMQFWNGRLPFTGHIIHWRYQEGTGR